MFDLFHEAWIEVHTDDKGSSFVSMRTKGDEHSVWLFFSLEDWIEATQCRFDWTYSDGCRQLLTRGEYWLIYSTPEPSPKQNAWEVSVKGVSLNMPRRALEEWSKRIPAALEEYQRRKDSSGYADRVRIPALPEWWEIYGRGKGQVKIEADEQTRDRLQECTDRAPDKFSPMIDRLSDIARACTEGIEDSATLRIWRDGQSFTWQAGGLFGGLINHGSEDEPSWSIHT